MTLKPTPGQITIPAVFASMWRRCAARKTSISPVISVSLRANNEAAWAFRADAGVIGRKNS
jgi:hypothetical protein